MVLTRKRSAHNDRGLSARDVKTYSDSGIASILDVPNLIRSQLESFDWFKTHGLAEAFRDCSPIVAGITRRFANGEASRRAERFELYFLDHWFDTPPFSPEECREREITYSQPLYVKAQLRDQENGEVTESDIFFGDMPAMTATGTFIINGAERGAGQPAATRAQRLLRKGTLPGPGLPGVRQAGELVLQGPHFRQPGRPH